MDNNLQQIIAEALKSGETADKERELESVKNLLLVVQCGKEDTDPLRIRLLNLTEDSFFISQIQGIYCKGLPKRYSWFKGSFMLNPDEVQFVVSISKHKKHDFVVWLNLFVTTRSRDTYKLVSEISHATLEKEEIHIKQLPIKEGRYVRLDWNSIGKEEGLLERPKANYQNKEGDCTWESLAASDIQIKNIVDEYCGRKRQANVEELYRIAKTEMIIDGIIKESKEIIKKIPVFKARPVAKLKNKISYLKRRKDKLIEKRLKLQEDQGALELAKETYNTQNVEHRTNKRFAER